MGSISRNIQMIRERISAVQPPTVERVSLVAATKMNDTAHIKEAILAGIDACGENKVQEFLEKDAQGAYSGCAIHFIGHLQKNKVNKIVGKVSLIQSVDSLALLEQINCRASFLGIVQDILIEINISGEPQKSGIAPNELPSILQAVSKCQSLRVRGLMCIPPIAEYQGSNRPYFASMRQLFIDNSTKKYDNVFMDFLSMGMSDDYLDAIAEGSNMVRIGTAIFGRRQY